MERKVYLIIASDDHMTKEYDKILSICDKEQISSCVRLILKNKKCGALAIRWMVQNILEDHQLHKVYRQTDGYFDFIQDSLIDNFTLRIEEVTMNEVSEY